MLHKGLKFAYVLAMIASAVMAFIVFRNFDEDTMAGRSFAISVDESPRAAESARVAAMIEAFAADRQINVGRQYFDPRDQSRGRIYLAVGSQNAESTRWLIHGYPAFSREAKVDLKPYREIMSAGPNGQYYVYGSERDAADLLAEFNSLGYEGRVEPLFSRNTLEYFGHGPVILCFILVSLIVILTVATAVVLNAKSYGVQRLQGQPFYTILGRDLRQLAAFGAIAALVVTAGTMVCLYAYNGLNQISTYALIAASFMAFYLLPALGTHVVTLAFAHRALIQDAIKGELTAGWAITGGYILRIASVALILSVAAATIGTGLALSEHRARSDVWAKMGDAYFLRLSGAPLNREQEIAIEHGIGRWIREADSRNEVSLAWHFPAEQSKISGPARRDTIVVNNKYLLKHEILDSTGSRVMPDSGDTIRILVPQRLATESPDIAIAVSNWAASMRTSKTAGETPSVKVDLLRDEQSLLPYARSSGEHDTLITDPILVVVTGASSGVIADSEYMSAASRGEVLVEDPDKAVRDLTDEGIGPYVLGFSPFAEDAADKYRDVKREFGLQVSNLVAAIAVLLGTAMAVSIAYCRRQAQTLFVKYIAGWSFLRTHTWILVGESALALVLVLWTWHRTLVVKEMYEQPGAPPPPPDVQILGSWETVLSIAVASLSLALIVVSLLRANAKFVKAHMATLS
ncbi:bacteriocin-associated integral membrane family protein [Micromonospora inaquosa]|uniref:ABC transporter permease n=1 Tax=Micromonospora inaquosa TaxID=2203716 RepID=A0A3N9WSY9_9ACTN|nr:hypothetical protein [Micromonospora inaquosa]RQX03860.1 hypothetical protein DLJ59_11105 [Micromonospora inaquosa]